MAPPVTTSTALPTEAAPGPHLQRLADLAQVLLQARDVDIRKRLVSRVQQPYVEQALGALETSDPRP